MHFHAHHKDASSLTLCSQGFWAISIFKLKEDKQISLLVKDRLKKFETGLGREEPLSLTSDLIGHNYLSPSTSNELQPNGVPYCR